MNTMNDTAKRAIEKLKKERQSIPVIKDSDVGAKLQSSAAADAKASLMANAVLKAMVDFCRQSSEFAGAVLKGGSFADCMKAAAKGFGNYAEGAEVCKKCVQFYVPGAQIRVQWLVEIPDSAGSADKEKEQGGFVLDLMDLLG